MMDDDDDNDDDDDDEAIHSFKITLRPYLCWFWLLELHLQIL